MTTPVTVGAPACIARVPRREPPPTLRAGSARAERVERFDVHQRIQHLLMFTSFTVLALTGLPQKLSDLPISQWSIAALGGLETVRLIHHTAAFVMLFDCVYHGVYLASLIVARRGRGPWGMVATLQDFKDAWHTLLYFLGAQRERPDFDRFTYLEKFDYWAVFWGIVVIGGSGLVLLFPVAATAILPGYMVPVAFVAHSDEAVLAVGWILVVHTFYTHLSPRVFPFNPSIFTGVVPRAKASHEHPRWIRRLTEDASKDG